MQLLMRRVISRRWTVEITPMPQLLSQFCKDQSGATAIEYGLIAAGIAGVIIAVVNGVGVNLNTAFGSISTALK